MTNLLFIHGGNELSRQRETEVEREKSIAFLQSLIRINSVNPKGNELEVAKKIAAYAEEGGLQTEIKAFTKGRANIVVRLEGKDSSRAPLVFSGHLDTVPIGDTPWKYDPFSGEISDGKIYGRGSCDMKGGVAAIIEAMIRLKQANEKTEADIIFAGTAGEEVDCLGARELMKDKSIHHAGAIVIAEPSNGRVFSAHKGALWLEIVVYGKTAHGSMPEQGVNAIVHMNNVLNKLMEYRFPYEKEHALLGKPSLNISTITGGVKTNVVPDQCVVTLDIRSIPEIKHETILDNIQAILDEIHADNEDFHAVLTVKNDLPALGNEENQPFIKSALELNAALNKIHPTEAGANYYTDGSVFGSFLNIPIIIYGPGDERLAHQPNEYVDIEQYMKSITYYEELAKSY